VRHAELHSITLQRERKVTAIVVAFDLRWQAPGECERVEDCDVRKWNSVRSRHQDWPALVVAQERLVVLYELELRA
jgi:hypothetical protein